MTPTTQTRTRFAPSPTGFIHLGNIRSALYPWAFARATCGVFVLRIEDTDVERSSQEAVVVIIEGMRWLGLDHDEGPFFQMQRMARYKEVLAELLASGQVYPCYMSIAELDALRDAQTAAKQKPRYDGTWRPEAGKTLPPVSTGVQPVLRFKNPQGGSVVWEDKVKGRIEISNDELDDLVIARPDGTPTYNFCVVVDDIDMAITHVIRGDDQIIELVVADFNAAFDLVFPHHRAALRVFETQHGLYACRHRWQGFARLGPPGSVVARLLLGCGLRFAQCVKLDHAHVAGVHMTGG